MKSIKTLLLSIMVVISAFLCGLTTQAGTTTPMLTIDGQTLTVDVGDVIDLNDKFFGYVTDKTNLIWSMKDNDSIYLVEGNLKIYALKAGSIEVTVKNPKGTLQSTFTIEVRKVNMYPEGDLEGLPLGSSWTQMNQKIGPWTLYTGYTDVKKDQIVDIIDVERDGKTSRVYHASHGEVSYSTIYQYVKLSPGDYYVELDIKGENLTNSVYARINQGKSISTQTTPVKGTFDWQHFVSTPVTVDSDGLKLELYGANFSGEVWFDNIGIYKVISSKYLSFNLNTDLISLPVGAEFQVNPKVNPESPIDFYFNYKTLDDSIASVDKNGLVKALRPGYTELVVTDEQYGLERKVYVIVGNDATFTIDDISLTIDENTTKIHPIEVEGNTEPIVVFPYTNPQYGDYYIKDDNTIVYSPKRNFNSNQNYSGLGEQKDSFSVIVYEPNNGHKIVDVEVFVQEEDSSVVPVDFWLTTPKNTLLEEGYLEYKSADIETEIPYSKETDLKSKNLLVSKENAYKKIKMTLSDGSFTGTTKNGGQVEILGSGAGKLIKDRYYSSTGKVIFGSTYKYTPKDGFIGYDTFDVKIVNGDKTTYFTVTVYVLPDLEDFKFGETDFSGVYLLTNDEWLEETRNAYKNGDPYLTKWVKNYEDRFRVFNPTGVPANARGALEQLAILYQVTGDKRYADLAWLQMHEVTKDNTHEGGDGTKRSSWGQDSNGFLDAAMVTYSVAVAYNYIQDTLTETQKLQVVKALYEEGFYYYENLNNPNVLLHGNNHGLLIGGNMATAALGVMSYDKEITVNVQGNEFTIDVQKMASDIVTFSYKILQIGLVHYSPSGGYPEGPSYSYYAHRNIIGLLATLRNIYGTDESGKIYDFGLSDIPGIANYPVYTLYTSTPNYDTFYYNEADYSLNQPGLLWYARVDDKYIPYTMLNKIADSRESYNITSLLWYKPGSFDDLDISSVSPYDALLEVHEIASFRNSFGDPFGIFTALKGFDPNTNLFTHKSLDNGTFEIVALGEKFIENFSDEDYHTSVAPGYWDYDYGRWMYYRKQVQGHNTLVFNPSDNPVVQQDPNAKAPIVKFESNSDGGYAIVDLTDAYASDVLFYQRGLMLSENRSVITLQDEFKLRKSSEVYWSAHTEANIELVNEKLAVLTLNGKKLYAQINSEIGKFAVMPSVPLPGTKGEFFNTKSDGINKLIIKLEDVTEGTLNVTFTPSMTDITEPKTYEVKNLADWKVTTSEVADIRVSDISFNAKTGNKYKYEFLPYQYTYLVKLDSSVQRIPHLNVTYDKNLYDIEIKNAIKFADVSTVTVTEKATGLKRVYTYRFITDIFVDGYEEFTKHEVKTVTGDGENLNNLIDNDRNTRWTSLGRNEIIFEFADVLNITNVSIRFGGGAIYQYYFDIYAGNSLNDLEIVYNGGQSNNEIGDEFYTLGDVKAKIIKIVFKGNNETGETIVSRVNFYQNLEDYSNQVINDQPTETPQTNYLLVVGITLGSLVVVGGTVLTILKFKRKR